MAIVLSENEALTNAAANLRRKLEFFGWSQVELAERAATNQPTISNLIHQKSMPGVAILARIAEALETTVDQLVATPKENSRQPA